MNDYKERDKEEKQEQIKLWKNTIVEIFNKEPNDVVSIFDENLISEILNKLGNSKAMNHTFMPSGGGLDLSGSEISNEKGKIELHFDEIVHIVNPQVLTFHPIGKNPEWWYFRLNTLPFEASGVYEDYTETKVFKASSIKESEYLVEFHGEELLEIEPGKYIDASLWDLNFMGYDENGNEISIPQSARIVSRKHNGGDFVIFPKYSAYNASSHTYDARHNKMTGQEFHNAISQFLKEINK